MELRSECSVGQIGCGVAHSSDRVQSSSDRVQFSSDRVRRRSELVCSIAQIRCSGTQGGCSVAQIGCSVGRMVVCWLAVRQSRVRFSTQHPREVPPTEPAAVKIWGWASANDMSERLYECVYCNRKKMYKKSSLWPPNH